MFGVFGLLSLLVLLVPRGVSGPKEPRRSLYFIWLCHQNSGRGEGRRIRAVRNASWTFSLPPPVLQGL